MDDRKRMGDRMSHPFSLAAIPDSWDIDCAVGTNKPQRNERENTMSYTTHIEVAAINHSNKIEVIGNIDELVMDLRDFVRPRDGSSTLDSIILGISSGYTETMMKNAISTLNKLDYLIVCIKSWKTVGRYKSLKLREVTSARHELMAIFELNGFVVAQEKERPWAPVIVSGPAVIDVGENSPWYHNGKQHRSDNPANMKSALIISAAKEAGFPVIEVACALDVDGMEKLPF